MKRIFLKRYGEVFYFTMLEADYRDFQRKGADFTKIYHTIRGEHNAPDETLIGGPALRSDIDRCFA